MERDVDKQDLDTCHIYILSAFQVGMYHIVNSYVMMQFQGIRLFFKKINLEHYKIKISLSDLELLRQS